MEHINDHDEVRIASINWDGRYEILSIEIDTARIAENGKQRAYNPSKQVEIGKELEKNGFTLREMIGFYMKAFKKIEANEELLRMRNMIMGMEK